MKKLLSTLLVLAVVSTASASTPKNIIMVVADGMGPEYTTAYRYFADDPKTDTVETSIFDKYLVGLSRTYPANVSGYVTDSAAAATALAAGIKTYNGAVGVDVNKEPVETVLERAKSNGYKTGVVVTSQVNHATPASYLAHNESRKNYNEIADSYIDEKIENQLKFDVLFGGGWKYFIREDRNIIKEFQQLNVQYIDKEQDLSTLNNESPAIGLFDNIGLPWALDDENENRLSTMLKTAIPLLENKNGYFLLVEASQVDWAGHGNDIASAMAEMADLASTMEYLSHYVQSNPDTLVVLTADHSTGGMTIGSNGVYEWNPAVLKTMKHSPSFIAKKLVLEDISVKSVGDLLNFQVSEEQVSSIMESKKEGIQALADYNKLTKEQQKSKRKPKVNYYIEKSIKELIDIKSNTGWTTGGHTAIDVPVIAFGQGAENFSGQLNNTDIAKHIFKLLTTRKDNN